MNNMKRNVKTIHYIFYLWIHLIQIKGFIQWNLKKNSILAPKCVILCTNTLGHICYFVFFSWNWLKIFIVNNQIVSGMVVMFAVSLNDDGFYKNKIIQVMLIDFVRIRMLCDPNLRDAK